MSEVYELSVELSEADAKTLEEFDDERVKSTVREALEELTSAEEKRDELRDRRPEESGSDAEELSGDELEQAVREWLRGDRERDPRL
ncbi:hypothetical protein [Halolamina salifodinae]|uniref:Uncharacterized protein n=1 Tax=Halolamina salifodinae TaxID=1202767 RepID=A0A8T4GUV1_9EURY|nr:hypothetical protein [Halolamina salifodinae]MBP1985853.1 hypothetical protein [Halolamina salifodinae]